MVKVLSLFMWTIAHQDILIVREDVLVLGKGPADLLAQIQIRIIQIIQINTSPKY